MLKNYFKSAIRNLLTNKVFSLINIAGLSIGVASFILITLCVLYEKSFDGYHKNAEYCAIMISHLIFASKQWVNSFLKMGNLRETFNHFLTFGGLAFDTI